MKVQLRHMLEPSLAAPAVPEGVVNLLESSLEQAFVKPCTKRKLSKDDTLGCHYPFLEASQRYLILVVHVNPCVLDGGVW